MTIRLVRTLAAACLILFAGAAAAQQLKPPAGPPILEVRGKIANTTDGKAALFDLAALEAVGKHTIATSTKWTQGVVSFEGVRMRDLLQAVGAVGATEVVGVALNDYRVTIPIADFNRFDVILAYRRDGAAMPVRDKGPLWIMYPFDQSPDLRTDVYHSRAIWQLKALEVR